MLPLHLLSLFSFLLLLSLPVRASAAQDLPFLNYSVAGSAITITGSGRYNNRPLYGNHNGNILLGGDRALARYASDPYVYGNLMVAVVRGKEGAWMHLQDSITAAYEAGSMTWSGDVLGVHVVMSVAPMAGESDNGFVARITTSNALPGDQLLWAFGGATSLGKPVGWKLDSAIDPSLLSWGYDSSLSRGNKAGVDGNALWLQPDPGYGAYTATIASSPPSNVHVGDAQRWADPTRLLPPSAWRNQARSSSTAGLPQGLALHLDATTITGVADGDPLRQWHDVSGCSPACDALQSTARMQPRYRSSAINGHPAVYFDGVGSFLEGEVALPGPKTIVAVADSTTHSDACCSGMFTAWLHAEAQPGSTTNGIATKNGGGAGEVLLVMDWAGENDGGVHNVANSPMIVSALFADNQSSLNLNGCEEIFAAESREEATDLYALGWRASDPTVPGRFFQGALGEILVFDRVLSDDERQQVESMLAAKWSVTLANCTVDSPLPVGVVDAVATPFLTIAVGASSGAQPQPSLVADPDTIFTAAQQRVSGLATRVQSSTPDPYLDRAVSVTAAAVDGLFRANPPVYVHGALAWDVPLVGWRSQYGGTTYGWPEHVASEGRYMFGNQQKEDTYLKCKADASRLYTQEAKDSRFYGKGRVHGGDGMYDMQSQMFDQQIHMWRWTGNVSHQQLLYPALQLHAEWAEECFDENQNGLYHSYINTWPTDSVYYNGGESVEETTYMYSAYRALRDMAPTEAERAVYQASMDRIKSNFSTLWLSDSGHPAVWREEIGHRRLRPDAWAYSIFCPIDAGLLDMEQAGQALHYTEWGLQRDPVVCEDGAAGETLAKNAGDGGERPCGERMWTSNWVPSMWSVREFWPGDNYALAMAYFQVGQPVGGWALLQGNMMHDMFHYSSPGVLGACNGGIDFNDIVHPFARLIVEGLFGYRPNYPNGTVDIAPQFPLEWPFANFSSPDVTLAYSNDNNRTITLTVTLARPAALYITLPVRATNVNAVLVNGNPIPLASVTFQAGFGQSLAIIPVPRCVTAVVELQAAGVLPYDMEQQLAGNTGDKVTLTAGNGKIVRISDPQGVLASASIHDDGTVTGMLTNNSGHHMVIAYVQTGAVSLRSSSSSSSASFSSMGAFAELTVALEQVLLFKIFINDTAAVQEAQWRSPTHASAQATWTFVPQVPRLYNANVSHIYYPAGGYMSPRPATCSARIGIDGYSAWTFPYGQGDKPPYPDLSRVPALTTPDGILTTPAQGAKFLATFNDTLASNIAFTSMWDNFPSAVAVDQLNISASAAGTTVAWVLVAGSTNPMQTRLANARLIFSYDPTGEDADTGKSKEAAKDASSSLALAYNETLDLLPPLNYWTLSSDGGVDYNYARDAFCLPPTPPPQVQLGNNCRAMVYSWRLTPGRRLQAVTLETLSAEVVVGLLAISFADG